MMDVFKSNKNHKKRQIPQEGMQRIHEVINRQKESAGLNGNDVNNRKAPNLQLSSISSTDANINNNDLYQHDFKRSNNNSTNFSNDLNYRKDKVELQFEDFYQLVDNASMNNYGKMKSFNKENDIMNKSCATSNYNFSISDSKTFARKIAKKTQVVSYTENKSNNKNSKLKIDTHATVTQKQLQINPTQIKQQHIKNEAAANIHCWRDCQPLLQKELENFNQIKHSPPTRDVSNMPSLKKINDNSDAIQEKAESNLAKENLESVDSYRSRSNSADSSKNSIVNTDNSDMPPIIPPRKVTHKKSIKMKLKTPEKETPKQNKSNSKKNRNYDQDEVKQYIKRQKDERNCNLRNMKERKLQEAEQKQMKLQRLEQFQKESARHKLNIPGKAAHPDSLQENKEESLLNKPGLYSKWIQSSEDISNVNTNLTSNDQTKNVPLLKSTKPDTVSVIDNNETKDSKHNRLASLYKKALFLTTRVQAEQSNLLKGLEAGNLNASTYVPENQLLTTNANQKHCNPGNRSIENSSIIQNNLNIYPQSRNENVENIFRMFETRKKRIEYFSDSDASYNEIEKSKINHLELVKSRNNDTFDTRKNDFKNYSLLSQYNSMPLLNKSYMSSLTNQDNIRRAASSTYELNKHLKNTTSMDKGLSRVSMRGADDIYPNHSDISNYSISRRGSLSSLATTSDVEPLPIESHDSTLVDDEFPIVKEDGILSKIKKLKLDEKYLTKKEKELRQRKKQALNLLKWHDRLSQEEARVLQLEMQVANLSVYQAAGSNIKHLVDETSNKTEKKAIETQPSSQEPRPTLHYQTPASSLYPHIGQQKATTQVPSSQHNILPNVSNHESATDHDALSKSSPLDATLRNATTSPIHTLSPPQTSDSATEIHHNEKNTVVDVNDTRTALTQDDVSRQIEDLLHRYITSAKPQQDATSQQGWVANQVQKLLLGLSTAAVETDTSADLNLSITKQTSTDNLAALKSRPESTFTAECLKIFEESDVRMREGGLLVNQVTGHEGNKQKQMEDSSSTTNSKDAATSNVFNNKATTLKTHFDTAIEDSDYQKNKSIKTHIQDTITDSQDKHVGKASATIIDKTVNQNIKSKFNLNKLKNNIVAPELDNVVNDLDLETSSISTDILPLTDNDEKGSEDEPLKLKDSIENILLNKDDILTAKDDLNQKISDNFLIINNMTQKESDKIMPLALKSGVNKVKDDDNKNTVECEETSSKNNYEDDFDISKQTDVEENIKSSIEEDIKLNDNDVEDDDNKDEVDDGGEDSKTISSTSSKQVDSKKKKVPTATLR